MSIIVEIRLNQKSLDKIKEIAKHFGITQEDVIRNGIRMMQYSYEQDMKGKNE